MSINDKYQILFTPISELGISGSLIALSLDATHKIGQLDTMLSLLPSPIITQSSLVQYVAQNGPTNAIMPLVELKETATGQVGSVTTQSIELKVRDAAFKEIYNHGVTKRLYEVAHEAFNTGVYAKGEEPHETEIRTGKPIFYYKDRIEEIVNPDSDIPDPVAPHDYEVEEYMEQHLQFINRDVELTLLHLGQCYAQSIILQPFYSFNIEVSDVLLTQLFYDKNRIRIPSLEASALFNDSDLRTMTLWWRWEDVSDWEAWLTVFLSSIIDICEERINKARAILELQKTTEDRLAAVLKGPLSISLVEMFTAYPIIQHQNIEATGADSDVMSAISTLLEEGTIIEISNSNSEQDRHYIFPEMVNISEGVELFKKG